MKPIKPEQIDAILPFLDKFEAAGFSAGISNSEPNHLSEFHFDDVVLSFVQTLHNSGWVTPKFKWTNWQDDAQKYVSSTDKIDSADAKTIQKLFTTHVRKERFCEGHLAAMFEDGHILALLRRLRVIRSDMDCGSGNE